MNTTHYVSTGYVRVVFVTHNNISPRPNAYDS